MLEEKDVLIVGQGIAGSLLAWQAEQSGLEFLIYDVGAKLSASAVSSGLINPVTGRSFVKSWMINDLYPIAYETYRKIEFELEVPIVRSYPLWHHIPDIHKENLWNERCIDPLYKGLVANAEHSHVKKLFHQSFYFGLVRRALKINVKQLITGLRTRWLLSNRLKEELFQINELLPVASGFTYRGMHFKNVILAMGFKGIEHAKFFKSGAYRPVKGEVFLCRIKGHTEKEIIKHGKFIVPLGDQKFWIGSNYQFDYENSKPDKSQTEDLVAFLDNQLVNDYEILDHKSGIRPSTKFRRPLIGRHTQYPGLYLFNGLGTKGISLAPYFAREVIGAIMTSNSFSTEEFDRIFNS